MTNRAIKIISMYSDSEGEEESAPIDRGDNAIASNENALETDEFGAKKLFESAIDKRMAGKNSEKNDDADDPLFERPRRTSDWMSDDENADMDDDSSALKEPPPPARPDDFRTCSPSPAPARSPTPALTSKACKVPRVDSQTLVSYTAEDEGPDELHDDGRRKSKEHPTASEAEKLGDGGGHTDETDHSSKTAENSPHGAGVSAATAGVSSADDLDAYALLEKCLEKDAAAGSATPATAAGDSPAPSSELPELPPEPKAKCAPELEERFVEFFCQKLQNGCEFNMQIQQRKDFRNPSIYQKLIDHFGLDELGSNFKPSLFDPKGFKSTDFYDEIAKAQRLMMDKMEKEKPGVSTQGAQGATVAGGPQQQGGKEAGEDGKKRRSKWDNPQGASAGGIPKQAVSEALKGKN